VALPPGTLPVGVFLPGTFAPGALPILPGALANPGLTLPKISPAPGTSRSRSTVLVAHASAPLPQGTSLVGGQEIGLSLLATAFLIIVTRLSFGRRRRRHGRDPN
jgi:hypothetical protein